MFNLRVNQKAFHFFSVALLVAFLTSFGGVTPAMACLNGQWPDGTCKCVSMPEEALAEDGGSKFTQNYLQSAKNFLTSAKQKTMDTLETHLDETKDWKYLRGSVDSTYCFSMLFDAYTSLMALINVEWYLLIDKALAYFLEWACDEALTAFTNIISGACLSIPTEVPSLSLPSTARNSCDGNLSLEEMMTFDRAAPIDYKIFPEALQNTTKPISRWLGEDGRM